MLFTIDRNLQKPVQNQLREQIIAALMNGLLAAGEKMPSSRKLAKDLGISRTTVMIVYDKLVEGEFLVAVPRSGYRVSDIAANAETLPQRTPDREEGCSAVDWESLLDSRLGRQRNIVKPLNWQDYPYPFVYGQPDASLFPLPAWRECSRQAMSRLAMRDWANDAVMADDPELITEIRSKLLPKRGIYADKTEILITLGAQNALYLIAALLMREGMAVGIEDPGYPDARNIFDRRGVSLIPLGVDEDGVIIDDNVARSKILYVTPSHQYPTTVTLSPERRKALLTSAAVTGSLIIEDDFESDTNYMGDAVSALKSEDRDGRVIYVGSLSKSMFPGLRLGFIVAPERLIRELRFLRRLMLRHAPSNNQRTTALFIAQGYHLSYIHKLHKAYGERWHRMAAALTTHMPGMTRAPRFGGTSFWVKGPEGLDAEILAERALDQGVVLEPGAIHFMEPATGQRYFRLGFSSIALDRIEEGIRRLAALL
ncbi:PLP-dependent aminotransferase family protein [Sneathiella sp. CAU 1612]|uniref:PLP-dependent aminotransferase family protein n=1 Tax=Sneathiella sedimenti TaxID=2816034 RepID=A0ABS3F5H0_9PROT|nr:PLP-dependent aminotransferase family protein [Sneathiella sedimenti]MBO0333721.1 PLP-dependent aminotransferase family protein [Sneathiella sedimenti]